MDKKTINMIGLTALGVVFVYLITKKKKSSSVDEKSSIIYPNIISTPVPETLTDAQKNDLFRKAIYPEYGIEPPSISSLNPDGSVTTINPRDKDKLVVDSALKEISSRNLMNEFNSFKEKYYQNHVPAQFSGFMA
jgi:hypothetical protein